MKKWQFEGVCHRIDPQKLTLPDPDRAALLRSLSFSEFSKESKVISFCRRIAAFFIRFF
ncbi:MAG: hypothetical protein KAR01_00645 [Desulfocapsa sp.]|nr:hypothetical protein [Desulfocapsa sp.]